MSHILDCTGVSEDFYRLGQTTSRASQTDADTQSGPNCPGCVSLAHGLGVEVMCAGLCIEEEKKELRLQCVFSWLANISYW